MSDTPVLQPDPGAPATALPTLRCPQCEEVVPDSAYCGSCGAHLRHSHERGQASRAHSFAAAPDESVMHLAVVTSLFPHLAHRARAPFRMGLAVVMAALVAWALAGQETAMIATAAFGIPVVFLLYLWEVDPYESTFVYPTAAALVVGAGLGVVWGLVGGPIVRDALRPSLTFALTSGPSLNAAVVVPIVAQLLMCVPVVLLRLRLRAPLESLDGFAAGATGALGLTVGATLTELAPQLHATQAFAPNVTGLLTEAFVRGVSVPLVAALATGFFGAALWSTTGGPTRAGARWAASPLVALLFAVLLQVGLGFADIARLTNVTLIVVHLGAVAVLIVVMRIGLHQVLLHERHEVAVGPPQACSHCHHIVPAMPFCPQCGVARHATPRRHRQVELWPDDETTGASGMATAEATPPDQAGGAPPPTGDQPPEDVR